MTNTTSEPIIARLKTKAERIAAADRNLEMLRRMRRPAPSR